MATVNVKRLECDVYPESMKGIRHITVAVTAQTNDNGAIEVLMSKSGDLSPRALKRLQRFIARGLCRAKAGEVHEEESE